MATLQALNERLRLRMPNSETAERDGWIGESLAQHGYTDSIAVPVEAELAVVEYARYFSLSSKAAEHAETGSISMKRLTISRGTASMNYQQLLATAERDYRRAARAAGITPVTGGSVTYAAMARADGR